MLNQWPFKVSIIIIKQNMNMSKVSLVIILYGSGSMTVIFTVTILYYTPPTTTCQLKIGE